MKAKDTSSGNPIMAILASLDHLFGMYGASSSDGQLQIRVVTKRRNDLKGTKMSYNDI